jgi:hypothetical protein
MTEVSVLGKNYVPVGKQGVSRLILVSTDLLLQAQNKRVQKLKEELAKDSALGQELPKVSLAGMAKRELRAMSSMPFLPEEREFRPRKMEFCEIKAILNFDGKHFFIDPHYEDKKHPDN